MEEEKIMNVEEVDGATVFSFGSSSISGIADIEKMSRELRDYLEEYRPGHVVVDFEGVRFISSQMLGLLVDIWRRLGQHNGTLSISGINPQLNRVFKITNLDKIFQFYPDRESAIQSTNNLEQ
jgi:anti-sigma B factor antagonist